MNNNSFRKGNVDDHVDEVSIPVYKATSGKIDRIAIMSVDEKLIVQTHYIPGLRYVYCWGGACCKKYGTPSIRNIYPVVKYPTNSDGEIIDGDVELMILRINNVKDKSIRLKNKVLKAEGKKISDFDLLLSGGEVSKLDGGGEYVDYSIENAEKATWKNNPKWVNTLKAKWEFYTENILKTVATKIENDEEYYQLLNSLSDKPVAGGSVNNANLSEQKALPSAKTTIVEQDVEIDDFFTSTKSEKKTEDKSQPVQENKNTTPDYDMFS